MNSIDRNHLIVGSLMFACIILVTGTVLCCASTAGPTSNLSATPTLDEDAIAEGTLLELVNRSREQAGASPLIMDESLRQAARLHARRMVTNRRVDHQFAGEPFLLQRIADVSRLPLDRAGENIDRATCVNGAHEALMRSPPHRNNLLDSRFNLVGIAALWSHGHLYVVQDFAHSMPLNSPRKTADLVRQSIDQARLEWRLPNLVRFTPPHLDEAACALAREAHPNARLIAASYPERKIIAYTQSRPDVLMPGALRLLHDPNLREFAVGSCYARNDAYPTGIYWVTILLH
jgi:uncharacterized protein YkwD